jgi:hypothetical protein
MSFDFALAGCAQDEVSFALTSTFHQHLTSSCILSAVEGHGRRLDSTVLSMPQLPV